MILRRAKREDVPAIVGLLLDDEIGANREAPAGAPLPKSYFDSFEAIDKNPECELMVAEEEGSVIGTFQLTFLTHMNSRGSRVAQVESVHVLSSARRRWIGSQMMHWAIARAKEKGCARMQLTSNKVRKDAHRFYEGLGFRATHEGFKLPLPSM